LTVFIVPGFFECYFVIFGEGLDSEFPLGLPHTPAIHILGDVFPGLVAKALAEAQNVAVYYLCEIIHALQLQRNEARVLQVPSDYIGLVEWVILHKKTVLVKGNPVLDYFATCPP
jgi:hypothetical protein